MALLSESDYRLIQKHIKRAADPARIEARVSRRVAVEQLPRKRMAILGIIVLLGFSNWLLGDQSNQIIGQTASAFMVERAVAPDVTVKTPARVSSKTTTKPLQAPTVQAETAASLSLPPDNGGGDASPSSGQQYDSHGYSPGQCTWYVSKRRPIPSNWGNARDWLPRAKAIGWLTGPNPVVGAIAWTPSGSWGHVAYVEAVDGDRVQVSEMNYIGPYLKSYRWASVSSFEYIY